MSFSQSRTDKIDSQFRKSGRSPASYQQRSSSVAYSKGGGVPAPSSSLSSNRSFKKFNHHAQGGQSRVNLTAVNSSDSANTTALPNIQNGASVHRSLHGSSDAPLLFGTAKPVETPATHRRSHPIPKAPTSQPSTLSSETAPSLPHANLPGDASKFAFQFGSLGPAAHNGMQSHNDAFRGGPPLPTPTPKQQSPRKNVGTVDLSNAGQAYAVPKLKKDVQVITAPPVSQAQMSSVVPISMNSMQMPFHQPPGSMQFGGPNPQIQSQGGPPASLQLPMPMAALPMGNVPAVQQTMFLQGLQHHPMQPQGIIHHGQGLSFAPQMGPQLPTQLGDFGVGITSQYTSQPGGTFGGPRKMTVKITDPNTHEELRLDKQTDTYPNGRSSSLRSQPNVFSQSQPIPTFPPNHLINYYPNSYNPNNLFVQPSSSLPLTSGQIPPNSQQLRYNYSVSQGSKNVSFVNPCAINSLPSNKSGTFMHGVAELSTSEHACDVHKTITSTSSGTAQVKVKPVVSSNLEDVVASLSSNNSSGVEEGLSSEPSMPSVKANSSHMQKDSLNVPESSFQNLISDSESVSKSLPIASIQSDAATIDSGVINSLTPAQSEKSVLLRSRSASIKNYQEKAEKKDYVKSQIQIGGHIAALLSVPSHSLEQGISSNSGISDSVGTKITLPSSAVINTGLIESFQESVLTIHTSISEVPEVKVDDSGECSTGVTSEMITTDTADVSHQTQIVGSAKHLKYGTVQAEGQTENESPEISELENKPEISSEHITSESADSFSQSLKESSLSNAALCNEVPVLEAMRKGLDEPIICDTETKKMLNNKCATTSRNRSSEDVRKPHSDDNTRLYVTSSESDIVGDKEDFIMNLNALDQESAPVPTPDSSEATSKGETLESSGNGLCSITVSSSKEKTVNLTRSKSTTGRLKKKRKEILQKADAAGTTSDLYMAYKGPEEKKENVVFSEAIKRTSTGSDLKQESADALQVDSMTSEKGFQNKAEPNDWEDTVDISTPKLEILDDREHGTGASAQNGKDGTAITAKKYSRDFLLKFSEQCTDLPERFEITADIADALMNTSASRFFERVSYPTPGRIVERSNTGPWLDCHGSSVVDNDRWSKLPGSFGIGKDLLVDISLSPFGGNAGFRPGQGSNFGFMKHPRVQSPVQYVGGVLSGPVQLVGLQSVTQRSSTDADRWQRAANFQQKGLIPSPQTPLQMMHKAEKKYEVGKTVDDEESKQRQLKAILNKLTPQNFEKLFEQVKAVNVDNAVTLTGVISQIFDKALMEPTFCEMYANFCCHLAGELPDFTKDNEKITFKRLLLNKCQEEFERGEREQEEANKADEECDNKQSEEEREEKRTKARRRMLGNIRLIGELYKKKMLTERIMHECIKKLLGQCQNPDEEDVEALCKLMSTIGEMIDHPKAKVHMDAYFDWMTKLSNNMKLSSRVRFMLKDAIDLRKNNWQQRRKVEGPKKIEEVHRDAAQERHHQASRLSFNHSNNHSARRVPMDLGSRGAAMLSSPNLQIGSFHGLPSRLCGYGTQDICFEERQSYEIQTLSVPLSRPLGDESITLGPQGGLARGMCSKGPPTMAVSECSAYNSVEEFFPRYPDRFAVPAAFDQSNARECNMNNVNMDPRNQDHIFESLQTASPPGQAQAPAFTQNNFSDKFWSEDRLQDMSMAAIKEFYSARDEKEVALCIKELNSSSFHPSMISLWVTDSFERKDMERDVLAKLLVNLAKSRDGVLTPPQLIKGFELFFTTLEDSVNDAPKAAEFCGRILAEAVIENVVTLRDIGQLLHEGGEERGRLLEIGLAGDVLGSTLEVIRAEKGENVLNAIHASSNLNLVDFRPPAPNRSRILDRFI